MKKVVFLTWFALVSSIMSHAQSPIWVVGNQYLNGPNPDNLPTPAGPSGLDYAGQQAQYAANAWHNPQTGALMFFVVDGIVYDCEGYYLGTLNEDNYPGPGLKRIMGFSEVSIVPDPGDCKRFYIIGSSPNASMLNSPPIDAPAANIADVFGEMHFAVVNLGLPRENFNETRMGTLENLSTSSFDYIKSLRALIPPGQKYANNQNIGWTSVDFLAVSPKNSSNEHLIFYQDHFNILYTFKLGANGITYVNNSGFDTRSGQSFNNNTNVIIDHVSRSELELIVLPNGNYRVVGLSYNLVYETINNSLATLAANKIYRLDFGVSGTPISSSYAEHQHYQIPQGDGMARIKGIEVSPNKQFVYYTALNTTGLPRSIYCLDMNTFSQVSLPEITDAFSHQFKHSMIERANNGTADGAVYFSHPNGLFQLNNPNDPTIANLTQTLFVNLQMSRLNATAGAYNDDRIGLYLLPDQMDFDPNCQVGCYSFACGDNSTDVACCQFYSGFCSSTNEVVFDDIIVSSTTTWLPGGTINGTTIPANGQFRVTGNITIQPGATLTMEDLYIEFSPTSKVVVSRGANATSTGAQLNVINTTLTAAQICGDCHMWQGVEVGGYNQIAGSLPQGKVHFSNNSVVEYAYIGVSNAYMNGTMSGNQDDLQLSVNFSSTGGRIAAIQSSFLNNMHDAFFWPYTHSQQSYFDRCLFISNDDLKTNLVSEPRHITTWNNSTIFIQGGRFENETDLIANPEKRGFGVLSVNSQVAINIFGATQDTRFNNLESGIYASSVNSPYVLAVNQAEFNNNINGIYAHGENRTVVLNSRFHVFRELSGLATYGILFNGCNAYRIEDNVFTGVNPLSSNDHNNFGALVSHSGPYANVIEKNDFTNLRVGAAATGVNAEDYTFIDLANPPKGLQWLCNNFSDNVDDIVVRNGSIAPHQGNCFSLVLPPFINVNIVRPTGNRFLTNNSSNQHISLTGSTPPIKYFYNDLAAFNEPTTYTSNVTPISCTPGPDDIVCGRTFRDSEGQGTMLSNLIEMRNDYLDERILIEDNIDFGNRDSTLMKVLDPYISASEKRDMLNSGITTVSDQVLINYMNSNPPSNMLFQVLQHNSPLSDKVIYVMMEETNLPNGMKQQILFIQSGLSHYEACSQVLQEIQLELNAIESDIIEKYLTDTTGVYSMLDVVAMYKNTPIKDQLYQERLFGAYLGAGMSYEADSVATILKTEKNDATYNLFMDLSVQSLSMNYYEILTGDSTIIENLEMIAQGDDYYFAPRAKALLSGYLGYKFEIEFPEDIGTKSMSIPKYTYDGSVLETVSIFPNPAQDHFFIVFDENADVSQNREVKVYDLSGVLQFTREMKANDYVLEILTDNMAKGMYLVTISAEGKEISTQKVAVR